MKFPASESIRPHVGKLPGLFEEIAIDLFAGGGGMSTAWELATGRCVDEAVNHDADAIFMHAANHPNTRHWREDVWSVDPLEVAGGRPVGWLHGSPDCTHFSMARGGKPVRKEIRGLAWIIPHWAATLRRAGLAPRLITMENVREFLTWGPLIQKKHLDADGRRRWLWECSRSASKGQKKIHFTIEGPHRGDGSARAWRGMLANLGYTVDALMIPDPKRRGETFKLWKSHLESLGYIVECKVLDAADYGAPTHRKRLFIVARCDGAEIQWPEKTHGKTIVGNREDGTAGSIRSQIGDRDGEEMERGNNLRYPASSRQGLRIGSRDRNHHRLEETLKPFRTAAECIDHSTACPSIFTRKKELAENTLRRIVRGLVKFVINDPNPYIVNVDHGGPDFRGQRLNQPLPTICQDHGFALVTPSFVGVGFGRGFIGGCGGRAGQSAETPLWLPIGTITGKNDRILIAPHLVRCAHGESCSTGATRWGIGAHHLFDPLGSITGSNDYALVAPHLIQFNGEKGGEARGQRIDLPINTVPTENRFGFVTSFLYDRNGERDGQQPRCRSIGLPLGTIDATANRANLAAAYMVRHRFGEVGWKSLRDPMQTLCAQGNHFSLITPYLVQCANANGIDNWNLLRPGPTVTAYPKGGSWAVATPFLYKNTIGETAGQRYDTPMHVITQVHNKFQLVAPLAVKFYKSGIVKPVTGPLDAITLRDRFGLTCAWMVKHYGGPNNLNLAGIPLDDPFSTITAVDHHALACAWGTKMHGTSFGFDFADAMPTVTAGGNHLYLTDCRMIDGPTDDPQINAGFWLVHELLKRFLGADAPLPIVRRIDDNGIEQQYLIYDIGMRMLSPRELLNAQFGPELAKDYILTGTRESQVAKIGNSVPPYLGAAVIKANWNPLEGDESDRGVAA